MSRWKPDAAGRLMAAAITLFAEHGYDETTVAQIADRAGLTKRTFFRHFPDKREVLFSGAAELEHIWTGRVSAAAAGSPALAAVITGLDAATGLLEQRHDFARMRAQIITAHPELLERELIKLQRLAEAIARALRDSGVPGHAATLAAQTGITVFSVAYSRWVLQDDPAALRQLIAESLAELRAVLAS